MDYKAYLDDTNDFYDTVPDHPVYSTDMTAAGLIPVTDHEQGGE
jgi:hypothetical protein